MDQVSRRHDTGGVTSRVLPRRMRQIQRRERRGRDAGSLACSRRAAARHLTPGITRPHTMQVAFNLADDIHAESGRVDAVVRLRASLAQPPPPHRPRHHPTRASPAGGETITPHKAGITRGAHIKPSALHTTSYDSQGEGHWLFNQQSNARHHPRPHSTIMRGSVAGRRVHAVVRLRTSLAQLLPSASCPTPLKHGRAGWR